MVPGPEGPPDHVHVGRVYGLGPAGFRIWGLLFRVLGLGFGLQGFGVEGLQGLGFIGFRVYRD